MNYGDMKGNARRFKWIAIVTIGLLGSYYALASGLITFPQGSILSGFEGMQHGLYGYQKQGNTVTALGNTLPPFRNACSVAWQGSPTIGSAAIQVKTPGTLGCNYSNSDTLVLDAQTNPVKTENAFVQGKTVDYYVRNPQNSTKWMHVVGKVNIYTYSLDVSIQSGSWGTYNFGGDTVWYNLYANTWNRASSDPSNSSRSGLTWEAPLYAVVTAVDWQNQGTNGADATVSGHPFSFYSSPSTSGQTLATLAGSQFNLGTDVNSSLSSVYAPDSRLSRLVYYPITLNSFRANVGYTSDCRFGCTYPNAKITITLYTLQIGEYILTNPDVTGLGNRNQGCTGLGCVGEFFNGLGAFFSSPLGWLTGLLGAGIAIFVILAIFATPVIVALIWVFFGRRREKL